MVEIDEEKAPQRVVRTRRLFPRFSELQGRVDGVSIDATAAPSTWPIRVSQAHRDSLATVSVPHRKKWVQKREDRAKADRHYREYYLTDYRVPSALRRGWRFRNKDVC